MLLEVTGAMQTAPLQPVKRRMWPVWPEEKQMHGSWLNGRSSIYLISSSVRFQIPRSNTLWCCWSISEHLIHLTGDFYCECISLNLFLHIFHAILSWLYFSELRAQFYCIDFFIPEKQFVLPSAWEALRATVSHRSDRFTQIRPFQASESWNKSSR